MHSWSIITAKERRSHPKAQSNEPMKRKKWSELEEQTLLTSYSELLSSGTLAKLKTREKKFKPIADHVNAIHHLRDPIAYPFKWSWRDVSIKVQNMRHQYVGVKQKIRASDGEFNWNDGENHWENFLMYKEVFGDVELELKDNSKRSLPGGGGTGVCDVQFFDGYGLGFDVDCEGFDEDEDAGSGDDGGSSGGEGLGSDQVRKTKKRRLSLLGAQLLQLRESMARREKGRSERHFAREEELVSREVDRREKEHLRENRKRDAEERLEIRELELEEMQIMCARRELERQSRLQRELDEEKRWRMKMEEKREEEELQWKERLVSMQIEHEKQMIQMQANACQNQLQILGVMARFMCQFFGSASDGLSAGLGPLPPQILQNLQHPGGLSDNGKPDSNSPSEYL